MQAAEPRLILASRSAARRALLDAAGLRFETRPAPIDEGAVKQAVRAAGGSADDAALRLAELKAASVDGPGALALGADQMLSCDGAWFDKPADLAEAERHLRALRGRPHVLHTAAVLSRDGAVVWRHIAHPRLTMRRFSDAFLAEYLRREAAHLTDTVGCYRLEGFGLHLFEAVEGEHAAILGLPMLALLAALRERGVLIG